MTTISSIRNHAGFFPKLAGIASLGLAGFLSSNEITGSVQTDKPEGQKPQTVLVKENPANLRPNQKPPETKEDFERIALDDPGAIFHTHFKDLKNKGFAFDIVKQAIDTAPVVAFIHYEVYEKEKYAQEICKIATELKPQEALKHFEKNKKFQSLSDFEDLKRTAFELIKISDDLRTIKSFDAKQKYLIKTLEGINPKVIPALAEFNKKHSLSLEITGIQRGDRWAYEFVFADFGESPLRLGLTVQELRDLQDTKTFEEIYSATKKDQETQEAIWKKSKFSNLDLPKDGKTSFMLFCVPETHPDNKLTGLEIDLSRTARFYSDPAIYGAECSAVCMQFPKEWEKAVKESNFKYPKTLPATKKSVLRTLDKTLGEAVKKGQEAFVIHYSAHGDKGKIGLQDTDISAVELAKIIQKHSKDIRITVIAETCDSKAQQDQINDYFKKHRDTIPAKELTIIASADDDDDLITNYTASIPCEGMGEESTAVYAHYKRVYRDYIQRLLDKGIKLKEPLGTLAHESRVINRFGKYDSPHSQNLTVTRYSNNPKKDTYEFEDITQEPQRDRREICGLSWQSYLSGLSALAKANVK